MDIPTIGNSGAVYGILLAFGWLYPDRTVLFALIFPIPARVFVAILGGIQFLSTFGSNSDVSHVAHLGGMAFAWIYLRHRPEFLDIDWQASYRQWKLRRAQRKFQVYMKKKDGDGGKGPGGWVN
jgi:membrane associated rhomboid family serine protease